MRGGREVVKRAVTSKAKRGVEVRCGCCSEVTTVPIKSVHVPGQVFRAGCDSCGHVMKVALATDDDDYLPTIETTDRSIVRKAAESAARKFSLATNIALQTVCPALGPVGPYTPAQVKKRFEVMGDQAVWERMLRIEIAALLTAGAVTEVFSVISGSMQ